MMKGYSEEQEYSADSFGAKLAAAARFKGSAAVRLLERLAELEGEPEGLSAYFSSHPPLEERIERLRRESPQEK